MKHSLTLGLILATLSTSAFATTMATPPVPTGDQPRKLELSKMDGEKGEKMRGRMDAHMERMWQEMDTNNDGVISRKESTAFGNRKFDERDANKDGKVTREEWDGFRAARMEKMKEMRGKMGDRKPEGTPPGAPAPEAQ